MALSWGKRRKFIYTVAAGVLLLIVLALVYNVFFNAAPTCFDGKQNGDEHGVDCGGSCSLLCKSETHDATSLWSRAFLSAPGFYTAAAYVQNPNSGAAAKNVPYSFQLFDDSNSLVKEYVGTIDLPPVQTIPVIVPNINVGTRTVSRALFAFGADPVWQKAPQLPSIKISNQYLAPDASELSATVSNESLQDARSVTVAAVLFDSAGVARAASRSVLPKLARKSSQQAVFTWAGGVPGIVRAQITVLPSL